MDLVDRSGRKTMCGRDVEVKVASGDENIWLGG